MIGGRCSTLAANKTAPSAIAVTIREAEQRIYAPGELYTFDSAQGQAQFQANLDLYDRWHNAVKTFGGPDFIHRRWDYRAFCEIAPGDMVVFADGDEHSPINPFAFDDSANF